jgi:hypothetical protein
MDNENPPVADQNDLFMKFLTMSCNGRVAMDGQVFHELQMVAMDEFIVQPRHKRPTYSLAQECCPPNLTHTI